MGLLKKIIKAPIKTIKKSNKIGKKAAKRSLKIGKHGNRTTRHSSGGVANKRMRKR